MILKTNYDALDQSIATLVGVVTDKMASDTLKNIIFSVKADNSVAVAAYNTIVTCYTPLSTAEIDWQGATPEDTYFQLKADVIQTLATFKSLKKTRVEEVEIELTDTNALLSVHEVARDADEQNAEKYAQVSKFRVTAPKFAAAIRKELESKSFSFEGTVIPSVDIQTYLNTLFATLPPDSRDSVGTRIMAVGDMIYTVPQLYFAMMYNRLPEVFRDFILTSSAANFLKGFLALDETVRFEKTVLESGTVQLKFANSYSVAYINASGTNGALDCTPHRSHSNTGIALDKGYFADILKRASLGGAETCTIDIKIHKSGATEASIMSKAWKQDFAVLTGKLNPDEFAGNAALKGDGEDICLDVSFSIRPDLLSKLLFMHSTEFSDVVYLYFEPATPSGIKMAACDNTQIWQTKINTLAVKRGDFSW